METISNHTLRIIDANLNRIGEGLRFIEDVARMLLDDATLTQQLKSMRHEVVRNDWPLYQQLLQARDSESDVGVDIEVSGEEKQRELPASIVAKTIAKMYLIVSLLTLAMKIVAQISNLAAWNMPR